jgi:alkanesulfonate monooxygenase SsuD/methylene tetrahydromethanopterin reductase-like flavin-dependent oxidoreductase (luciferase family)
MRFCVQTRNIGSPDFESLLEQVIAAEKLGYDEAWIGDHHFTDGNRATLSPLTVMASFASLTKRIRLGTNVLLLPFWHPVLVAEEVATLDIISKGRISLGVGMGYLPEEYEAFGLSIKHRAGMLEESLVLTKKLLEGERVTFHGRYFTLNKVKLGLGPVQRPRPPIFIGDMAKTETTIRRAAEMADSWVTTHGATMEKLRWAYDYYRGCVSEAGRDPSKIEYPFQVGRIYIARDKETAIRECKEAAARSLANAKDPASKAFKAHKEMDTASRLKYGFGGEAPPGMPTSGSEEFTPSGILGSPDDCIQEIERYVKELRPTLLILLFQDLGMTQQMSLEQMRLFMKKVAPRLRPL